MAVGIPSSLARAGRPVWARHCGAHRGVKEVSWLAAWESVARAVPGPSAFTLVHLPARGPSLRGHAFPQSVAVSPRDDAGPPSFSGSRDGAGQDAAQGHLA